MDNVDKIVERFRCDLTAVFENGMEDYMNEEIDHIMTSLSGQNLFNLSDKLIEGELKTWINKGAKLNPHVLKSKSSYLNQFDDTFMDCTNKILKRLLYGQTAIQSRKSILRDLSSVKDRSPQASDLVESLTKSYQSKRSQFKHHIHRLLHSKSPDNVVDEKYLHNVFNLEDGRLIVESDKKLGFVVLNETTYRDAYLKINEDQHFHKADITEEWYLTSIVTFLREAEAALPRQLSKILKPKDFQINIMSPKIGCLCLLPKIQKLKDVSYASVHQLKCRGIKSAMHDPIQVLQIILDKVYSHLLYHLELQFISEFGKLSPSVSGVQEALDRLRATESDDWGTTLQFDADFKNMYSNCNVQLLKDSIKICAGYAGLSEATVDYINNLVDVNMTHSYFHEPTGIFHTASSFSMGDHSASRGSEVILRTSELGRRTLRSLKSSLQPNILAIKYIIIIIIPTQTTSNLTSTLV